MMSQSAISRFFRTTFVGAVMYLLPITVLLWIFERVLGLGRKAAIPIARLSPVDSVAGIGLVTILSVAIIVLGCYFAGSVSRQVKWRLIQRLEDNLLVYIPGYVLLQSWAHSMAGVNTAGAVGVVLARIEDAWQLAFLMETLHDGSLAVFVPDVPSPFSGTIYYLTEERVRRLDVPMSKAIRCIRRFGVGSKELLNAVNLK